MNQIAEILFATLALVTSLGIIIALIVSIDERKHQGRILTKLDSE
jgi:hypothetical protein